MQLWILPRVKNSSLNEVPGTRLTASDKGNTWECSGCMLSRRCQTCISWRLKSSFCYNFPKHTSLLTQLIRQIFYQDCHWKLGKKCWFQKKQRASRKQILRGLTKCWIKKFYGKKKIWRKRIAFLSFQYEDKIYVVSKDQTLKFFENTSQSTFGWSWVAYILTEESIKRRIIEQKRFWKSSL